MHVLAGSEARRPVASGRGALFLEAQGRGGKENEWFRSQMH